MIEKENLDVRTITLGISLLDCIDSDLEVLKENIKLNHLSDRMRVYCNDIRELPDSVRNIQYDMVLFNPPFFNKNNGPKTTQAKTIERLNGRFEENGDLDDFVRIAAGRVLPTSGYVCMIMKGDRLNDCLRSFEKYKITPTTLLAIHPFEDKSATSILLCGKRGVKTNELNILPPLILNERDSEGNIVMTKRAKDIYDADHTDCFI